MRAETPRSAEAVICGAGIAGVSVAYHLAVKRGVRNILLVDQGAPLSLTSDQSTECYRNWWPGPGEAMVALMNRSIDLLEELAEQSGNIFHLNRRGYLYCTRSPEKIPHMIQDAQHISALGAGTLRIHQGNSTDHAYTPSAPQGYKGQPSGADLLLDADLIQHHFPYLSQDVVAALHVRRAGWLSAQQLGMYMLERARACGVEVMRQCVQGVQIEKGKVNGVKLASGEQVICDVFINAAGPHLREVGYMVGIELPVHHELHLKVNFKDNLGVLPRDAPLVIYDDAQELLWSEAEREMLEAEEDLHWLLDELPAGAHARPEGGDDSPMILLLWPYHLEHVEPGWPIPEDLLYPEMTLRGLSGLIPGLEAYLGKFARPWVDGGYYTKTRENRPLIGPMPIRGAFLIGALSGYGIMAACAAGELLAAHVTGETLPSYAPAFSLERYHDPDYLNLLQNWGDSGQL